MLSVIKSAVENGFEFDPTDTFEEVWEQAEDWLRENEPNGHQFIQCDFHAHGMSQNYLFIDEDGYETDMTGEIFDFPKARAEKEVYFKKDGDTFTPVNWFDIPDESEEGREDYVFVYDYIVCHDGIIAYLYDTLK